MSRRVNCRDNAVAESFFSSLKKEGVRKRIYKTRDTVRADVFNYIEAFYNRARRHSYLGRVSPEALPKVPHFEAEKCLWGRGQSSADFSPHTCLKSQMRSYSAFNPDNLPDQCGT